MSNCLLVAPKTDLIYADEEVRSVVNLLGARLLNGNVTLSSLLQELQRQPWDIVWFATHGSAEGILLSDGLASTAQLTPLLHSSGATLVVLNTCSSLPVALALHAELGVDFLCTVNDTPDRTAYVNGATFAFYLAKGYSAQAAWAACGLDREHPYLFFPGTLRKPIDAMPARLPNSQQDPLERISDELERLTAVIDGSTRYNTAGVVPTINYLRDEVVKLRSGVRFLWIVCALLFVMSFFTMLAVIYLVQSHL